MRKNDGTRIGGRERNRQAIGNRGKLLHLFWDKIKHVSSLLEAICMEIALFELIPIFLWRCSATSCYVLTVWPGRCRMKKGVCMNQPKGKGNEAAIFMTTWLMIVRNSVLSNLDPSITSKYNRRIRSSRTTTTVLFPWIVGKELAEGNQNLFELLLITSLEA